MSACKGWLAFIPHTSSSPLPCRTQAGKDPRKLNEERVQNSQDQLYYSRKARHVEYK